MTASRYKGFILSAIIAAIAVLPLLSTARDRPRNTVYILDCTGSMAGYNGAPDIWEPTKTFLKNELEKEAREHPDAKVTLLPFQDRALAPVRVDLKNISWPGLENSLNGHLRQITRTNICDAWLEAEKFIDQSCDNYIVLMTDGQDNVYGPDHLGEVLKAFCGKFQNTKGFYIELTKAAALPEGIQSAIDLCNDIYTIPGTDGIPSFGCSSEDVIHLNTRDLPSDITLGFSNSGTFKASLAGNDNPFVKFSIVGDRISGGRVTLRAESRLGDNVEALNKAIGAPSASMDLTVLSDDIIITNPRLEIILHTAPLRSLDIPAVGDASAK
ncbi:MAG: VWA domain-containing protein, partial [Bacteroides sp.]|nr:VWA domain-containing protein [Bacteroides sp.]